MTTGSPQIRLSEIDEARFGVRSARAVGVTAAQVEAISAFCHVHQVQFLVARCWASELAAAQAMERQGCQLMDTLVYLERDLTAQALPALPVGIHLRPVETGEVSRVAELAAGAFRDYGGHYHADPRLDRAACDAVYTSWAERSCASRQVADAVLVAELEGRIVGFITLRHTSPDEGEGPLYGVDPTVQGRGVGRALMIGALGWLSERGARRMVMSTQITNRPSQKVWLRLGFEPKDAEYTFHKWFD